MDELAIEFVNKERELLASIGTGSPDLKNFEGSIMQIISYYEVAKCEHQDKYLMYGLYLMFLLASKNRLSDFHMILEKIPQDVQLKNALIATPVKLEQSLTEGAYNKVVLTEKNIPSPYYAIFIRIMMDTVRENIAYSVQKSVKMLSLSAATTMLLFQDEAQTTQFAKQHNWKLENGYFVFEIGTAQEKQTLDTTRIAKNMIYYAKQLEMIV